jgi:hypothetical protein
MAQLKGADGHGQEAGGGAVRHGNRDCGVSVGRHCCPSRHVGGNQHELRRTIHKHEDVYEIHPDTKRPGVRDGRRVGDPVGRRVNLVWGRHNRERLQSTIVAMPQRLGAGAKLYRGIYPARPSWPIAGPGHTEDSTEDMPYESTFILPFVQAVEPQEPFNGIHSRHILPKRGEEPLVIFQVGPVCWRCGGIGQCRNWDHGRARPKMRRLVTNCCREWRSQAGGLVRALPMRWMAMEVGKG